MAVAKKRATIKDVAARAEVSYQTVSRVLNNTGNFSATTQKRVLAAARALGYRPSRLAQSLVTQRTHTVGLVVGDITNPFFPEVARGAQDLARKKGYNVFLCNSDGNPHQESSTLQSLADHAVDGIIVFPSYESGENLKAFAAHYQPLVVVSCVFEQPGVSQVLVNNYRGAILAVDYLVAQGHTAIGMLTGVQNPWQAGIRRIQGFREALQKHNLPLVEAWLVPGSEPTFECGYESTQQLLKNQARITAIFAYNDLLALGAMRACYDLGLNVPQDCAVVGFDDIRWAATSTPALTTIHVNKYQLGQIAMTRVLEMLEKPGDASLGPISLDVELIVRESA